MKNKKTAYTVLVFIIIIVTSCYSKVKQKQQEQKNTSQELPMLDLNEIKERGELIIVTLNSSIDYFKYRGQEMGIQYELSKQFAGYLGLRLKVVLAKNVEDLVSKLNNQEADLIAFNLPITKSLKEVVHYCGNETRTHQVLIQRNKNNNINYAEDVTKLIGKKIYVQPGKYYERIKSLNEELGSGIQIQLVQNDTTTLEDLITQVSLGEIDITIADSNLAQVNKTYYPNLDITVPISFDQRSSWAVRKDSPLLAQAIEEWSKENYKSPEYKASMKRYFEISKSNYVHSPILSEENGVISKYDSYFKKYAPTINWDWRLVASLAYNESNFNPNVVSWAGARGLMQLMPRTARAMGVPPGQIMDIDENVKAAIKYIGVTQRSLMHIENMNERLKFILAAYNAGLGHVQDAMALAEKYNKNQYVWYDNVENFLLLKSNPEYFSDSVCKYGYLRGIETYNFVRDIMTRYEVYKSKIPL